MALHEEHGGIDSAAMADLTLPTGDRENFLGTGRVQLRLAYIASKTIRKFTPHVNVGYQARFGVRLDENHVGRFLACFG